MELKAHTIHILAAASAAALLVVSASGCGSTSHGATSASDFIRLVTTEFARGQTGPLWDSLHPSDQAIVSRARYMACQSNEGFDLQHVAVLDSYADPVSIAGKTVGATAVTLKVTADDGVTTATMHALRVNGGWRWILSAADHAFYASGKCPKG